MDPTIVVASLSLLGIIFSSVMTSLAVRKAGKTEKKTDDIVLKFDVLTGKVDGQLDELKREIRAAAFGEGQQAEREAVRLETARGAELTAATQAGADAARVAAMPPVPVIVANSEPLPVVMTSPLDPPPSA